MVNCTLLGSENKQLNLLLKNWWHENAQLSLLLKNRSHENTQLKLNVMNTMQDKTGLEMENKELSMLLNSTMENRNLVEEQNRQHTPTFTWHLQKANACCYQHEQLTSMQQEAENKLQCSILFSDKLSFLWKFCNKRTLQCSCGLPGWAKNASRCFFLSQEPNKWEDARRECLGLGGWPGLLSWMQKTNMTTQFVQLHPQKDLHSAWIGLQDMEKEVDQLQQTHVRCHLLETSGARWCHRFLGHGWGRTGLCC